MEMDAQAAAAAGHRRWESSSDDVIVLSSGREPRQQEASAVAVAGQGMVLGPPEKVYYKTRLCEKYEASGRCMYEDGCTFAHGTAELRPPLPMLAVPGGGGWRRPPEHEHARGPGGGGGGGGGRVCFEFRDKGTCHFGDKCAFAHASAPEMRHPAAGADARRSASATPPARVIYPAPVPPRGNSYAGGAAAPALARPFPTLHAADAPDLPDLDDGKAGALTRLSRKKRSSIYGDWPEHL